MQSWMARVNRITSILKQTVPPCVTTLSREMELFVGSEHSRLYQKHRPAYPSSLYQFIADFCKTGTGSLDSAVDVGCGTGLSTRPLCEHFRHVIGVDVSETQIKMAREAHAQTYLSFEVSEAERLTFMHDASTDLVTVAQAIHWIDQEPFYKEVERYCCVKCSVCLSPHYVHCYTILNFKCNDNKMKTLHSKQSD